MWGRLVNAALGIWLMAAPAVLDYGEPASTNDRVVGPIAAAVAIIGVWEIARGLRWINLAIGLWLVVAPWVLGYETTATVNSTIVGLIMAAVAPTGGRLKKRIGGGWSALWPPCSDEQRKQTQGGESTR